MIFQNSVDNWDEFIAFSEYPHYGTEDTALLFMLVVTPLAF